MSVLVVLPDGVDLDVQGRPPEEQAQRDAVTRIVWEARVAIERYLWQRRQSDLAALYVVAMRPYAQAARKPSPATSSPGDRPAAPAERRPGARRRRRRKR